MFTFYHYIGPQSKPEPTEEEPENEPEEKPEKEPEEEPEEEPEGGPEDFKDMLGENITTAIVSLVPRPLPL